MGTFCKNIKCAGQTWFGEEFCEKCLAKCLENALNKSLDNFGRPKTVGCNTCGHWFKWEDFSKHFPCENEGND